jgi:hypothetical protein
MSRFLASDWLVFKLMCGGLEVLGLALNLVSYSLTLKTLILLASLRFGLVDN